MEISYITLTFILIMVAQLLWAIFTRSSSTIKTLKRNLPLVGNSLLFVNRNWFNRKKTDWYDKYSDSFIAWVFYQRAIFTRDVSICEKILSSPKYLFKGLQGYWVLEEWLGNGLILSEGNIWRKRRKIITPAFHFNTLNQFDKIIEKQTLQLVRKLGHFAAEQKPVDVFDLTKPYSMSIICETAMGLELSQVESGDGRYDTWFKMVGERMFKFIVFPWLWSKRISQLTKDGRLMSSTLGNLHEFVKNIIENRLKNRKNIGTTNSKIFIDVLLDAYEKGEIDIEGILDEVNTFVNAGYETTSTALAWCLYCLGRNQDVQDKLYKELSEFPLHSKTEESLLSNLKALRYLDCVIKETMRLHPPVPVIARTLQERVTVGTQVIPKGILIIDIISMNRNPRNWENAMDFIPERFEDFEEKKRSPFLYIPFSAGPRNCIGQRFAMFELKVALYHLIRTYQLTSLQKENELKETFDFFHGSENGLLVLFKERSE